MKATWLHGTGCGLLFGTAWILCAVAGLRAEPAELETNDAKDKQAASRSDVDESARVPVAIARDRVKVMQDIYAATLHMMHERYFHGERATVPARALQDVFAEIKRQSHTDARWISVNLKPMSIDHEPKTDFEKRAAKELAKGKTELEVVEDGYYRRAVSIPLGGGCIGCHAGSITDTSTAARFAGLVISMPVTSDTGPSP
jgi:hypothetical protein